MSYYIEQAYKYVFGTENLPSEMPPLVDSTNAIKEYNLLIVGDRKIGKSQLIQQWKYGEVLTNEYKQTEGIETSKLAFNTNKGKYIFNISEIGNTDENDLNVLLKDKKYDACLIVYDSTEYMTKASVQYWYKNIKELYPSINTTICSTKNNLKTNSYLPFNTITFNFRQYYSYNYTDTVTNLSNNMFGKILVRLTGDKDISI